MQTASSIAGIIFSIVIAMFVRQAGWQIPVWMTAAGTDTRIKAVATLSMYDMSRDMSRRHIGYYTDEQRNKIKRYLSEQRWKDAEEGDLSGNRGYLGRI